MDLHFSDFFKIKFLKMFGFIFGLNLVFLLIQLVFISSLSIGGDISSIVDTSMGLPASQYWRFITFGLAQVGTYFLLSVFIWIWACLSKPYLAPEKSFDRHIFFVWLSSIVLILALNIWMYPASRFNWFVLPGHNATPLVLIVLIWFVHQSRYSFFQVLIWIKKYYLVVLGLIALGLVSQLIYRIYESYTYQVPQVSAKPNVILIGMDDLRPDVLGNMPILTGFLAKSTNFTESLTPEARTFVAWTSLLTGLYPKEHGIRFDMQSVDHYTPPGSLAQILREQGYTTFYSTDDDQYADVTKKYGFDYILTPKMDAAEYILSLLNDLPLTNLLSQTWYGKWFFPDTYNNRAAPFVYEPMNYNQEVLSALKETQGRPIFIALHFNLSHQPFYWAKHPLPIAPLGGGNGAPEAYTLAAKDMDWQFGEFLKGLKSQGLLKNAIVVVFSDHGESLGMPHERSIGLDSYLKGPHSSSETLLALSLYSTTIKFDEIFGHGTDIASEVQWHQILGIRWFSQPQYVGAIQQRVSLIDIKPTVLDLLGVSDENGSGKSLKSMILTGKPFAEDRYFFMDTGFNPFAIQDLYHVSVGEASTTLKYFDVLPDNGRLVIRPTLMPSLIEQIQHAVVYKQWMLAVYPARKNKQVWILVDLNTKQWTDDFSLPFAKKAPLSELIRKMKQFYGDEV